MPLTPNESQSLDTELKYVVPAHRAQLALRILEGICDPDPQFPFGVISSIYYDSRNWDYLRDKRDSNYLKSKVRLRWYEDIQATSANEDISYAETKYRIGSRRRKMRIPTGLPGTYLAGISLNSTELLEIPALLATSGVRIPQPIFPAFTVRYCRRRFVEKLSGARISIDYDITAPKSNPLMLATMIPCALNTAVLEVKRSDGNFPLSLRNLLKLGFRRASFSKYYECYSQLTGTYF